MTTAAARRFRRSARGGVGGSLPLSPPPKQFTHARTRLSLTPFSSIVGFSRFVEVGRVVLINYGTERGKLATIIDIVDGNKALIDGPLPLTGVARQVIPFKRLSLTDIKINIPKNARQKTLCAAWTKNGVQAAWDATSWAKKLQKKKQRAGLNDFQRFQLMVARKQRSAAVATAVKAMA